MGIMVVWMADAADATGTDPFAQPVDRAGLLSHGHLPENDNHGGAPDPKHYEDLTKLPSQVVSSGYSIPIDNFVYARGDMSISDSVPTVKSGGTLTFDNTRDAPLGNGIWHTITACKAPCNGATGIAYPLANGQVTFDSGELGNAGVPTSGQLTWQTPNDLPPGTYTYFCRIHPFMRGAFRVEQTG
jgi:plastocyanin